MSDAPAPASDKHHVTARLVRCARAGDRGAFDRLMVSVRPSLQRWALAQTRGDAHQAGDLVQEVCVRAWAALPRLQNPEAFAVWLRTIAANVQYDRARRTGFAACVPLHTVENAPVVSSVADDPAHCLLARERQRELMRALRKLPGVNCDALLWHVWGHLSYGEIAALQAVPVSTVEGRIYRAKRQVRKLLLDEGAAFFAAIPAPAERSIPTPTLQRKPPRTDMSLSAEPAQSTVHSDPPAPLEDTLPLALVLFAQRLAALIDGGVSLTASLDALTDLPAPYGESARELRDRIRAGELPSRILSETPERWGDFFIALVHVGEMGGILEETLRRAAQLLTLEWQRVQSARATGELFAPLLLAAPNAAPPAPWETQTAYRQTLTRFLFCECAALLLASSVPTHRVWQTCGAFLPPEKRALLPGDAAASNAAPASEVLQTLQIFPAFVQTLTQVGEANGTLDLTFHKAAEALEQELACLV